jgi:hypothetical protein
MILAQAGGPAGASSTGTGPTGGVPSPQTAGEPRAPTASRGAAAGATGSAAATAPDFSMIDKNRDGQISRAEWDAHYRASGGATTGAGTTGTTAGPGSASPRTGTGSDTATTPGTSGHGKAQ